MKKNIFILIMFAICLFGNAQSKNKLNNTKIEPKTALPNTFKAGQLDLNIGLGFGRNGYYYRRGYHRSSMPISASLDYGITKNVSIGGYFAYSRTIYKYYGNWKNNGFDYNYTDTHTWSYYIVGLRGAFHFSEYIQIENLDLYAGAMTGYNFSKYKGKSDNLAGNRTVVYSESHGGLVISLFGGARYMFSDKLGVFGEFGYGLSFSNIGLNIKLN